eukprot:13092441-Ditylum_brightwellii.AAC.1
MEGHAQGCPLSTVFAAMGLGKLIIDLNKDLLERCKTRKYWVDPGWSDAMAFVDDTHTVLLLEDVHWYSLEFIKLGKHYGHTIDRKKTKILTSIIDKTHQQLPNPNRVKNKSEKSIGPS